MSLELEELYQEVILDHSRRPRNFGVLENADVLVHGDNPARLLASFGRVFAQFFQKPQQCQPFVF